jgi:hypothetical protein
MEGEVCKQQANLMREDAEGSLGWKQQFAVSGLGKERPAGTACVVADNGSR